MTRSLLLSVAVLSVAALLWACAGMQARAAGPGAYRWRNVPIGGGGFVTGILYSPLQKGLVYARTDVGGAYRSLDHGRTWVPLDRSMDRSPAGMDRTGVLALALDPQDPRRLYMATGLYTQDWWPVRGGTLYASADWGRSFTRHPLPFKLGGNTDGRGAGERLQVDPKRPERLYLGSSQDGLWMSPDRGATWARLAAFQPRATTFVHVDPAGPGLLVGVADPAVGLLHSPDEGLSWRRVPGLPEGLMALRWARAGRRLLLTASDSVGPNGASRGGVFSLDLDAVDRGLSALPLPEGQGGFGGVDVDPRDPDRLVASTLNRWQPGDEVYLSRDGGRSWTGVLRDGARDPNGFPWVERHTPHWIADVKLDPFDPDRALFVTGYGLWGSRDLRRAGQGPVTWSFDNRGLEETCVLRLVSPPWGAPLYSAMGDQGGFSHWDLAAAPSRGQGEPPWGTSHSVAAAWGRPGLLVRVGWFEQGRWGAYSRDAGRTWAYFPSQPQGREPGHAAVAADGSSVVWCPVGGPCARSADLGATWTPVQGLPQDLRPEADTVDPRLFYALDVPQGRLYASLDGGAVFQALAQAFPPNGDRHHADVRPVPGRRGHVWVSLDPGLWVSQDAGQSFRALPGFEEAGRVGFGAPAPGREHPCAYAVGRRGGIYGFFRSDDGGTSWIRVNDDRHQFGYIHGIQGDSRRHGRVFVASEGHGILVGEAR